MWEWYKFLKENRAAITHRAAIYIDFSEDGRVRFIKPPKEDEWLAGVYSWPTESLDKYVNESYESVLDFLEFYMEHFHRRIPDDFFTRQLRESVF